MTHAEASASEAFVLPALDLRAELDRILKSADFEATPRERRFLSYVVEETLAGRASRIKAYSIAIDYSGEMRPPTPRRSRWACQSFNGGLI